MALTNLDRDLLEQCLSRKPEAWREFTDRFLGLVLHVVNQTVTSRNIQITPESRDDLVAEVFLSWLDKDFSVLRRFRGQSSLATYLTVVARRIIVRRLSQLRAPISLPSDELDQWESASQGLSEDLKESLEGSLEKLSENEARAIRMFHLEGRSYQDISQEMGMPANSIGPFLSRAREKLKTASR